MDSSVAKDRPPVNSGGPMKEKPESSGEKNKDEMPPSASAENKNLSMTASQDEVAELKRLAASPENSDKDKGKTPLPMGGTASAEPATPDEGDDQQRADDLMQVFRSSKISPTQLTELSYEFSIADKEGSFDTPNGKLLRKPRDLGEEETFCIFVGSGIDQVSKLYITKLTKF